MSEPDRPPITRAADNKKGAALLVSPEEAATALGIGRTLLYELLATGELRSVKIGRARRVRWSDLETYVEQLA